MPKASHKSELPQVRDTVESVYIAIVLAFVLRAFTVEAFVIPTGSMANSLYGEHFQLNCPCCQYDYAFGLQRHPGQSMPTVTEARCPNCGYRYDALDSLAPAAEPKGGDRVLVLKYLYDFKEPQPWDVVVFKNPQSNRENYIKRLIGLPGEAIQIVGGDIFVSTDGGKTWHVRRKPPYAQEAMWQVVFDNDYQPDAELAERVGLESPSWQPGRGGASWDLDADQGRTFSFNGAADPAELQFDPGRTRPPQLGPYRPKNGYNAPADEERSLDLRHDICTDWNLRCVLRPDAADAEGTVGLTFLSRGDRIRAEFNLAGTVRLLRQDRALDPREDPWETWGTAEVGPFTPARGRRIELSHADYRATVRVDGTVVLASSDDQQPGRYDDALGWATLAQQAEDNAQNLDRLQALVRSSPDDTTVRQQLQNAQQRRTRLSRKRYWWNNPAVHIDAVGKAKLKLFHLRLQRDVFYTDSRQRQSNWDINSPVFDYYRLLTDPRTNLPPRMRRPGMDDPGWAGLGRPIVLKKHPDRPDLDEFFCLGDNSTQSHDGRSWVSAAPSLRLTDENGKPLYQLGTVPRYNLLGRAILVYWPAGYRLPVLGFPIVPNVGRMRLIR